MRPAFVRLPLVAVLLVPAVSCDDPVDPPEEDGPASIELVGDYVLTVPAGEAVPEPLTVRIVDADGLPLAGVEVTWRSSDPQATLSASTTTTDGDGLARVQLVASPVVGVDTMRAVVGELSQPFRVHVEPGTADSIVVVRGDAQRGPIGARLAMPVQVQAFDRFGNIVPNRAVSWSTSENGGSLTGAFTTDLAGRAAARWVLDPDPGVNDGLVTIDGSASLALEARGDSVFVERIMADSTYVVDTTNPVRLRFTYADATPATGFHVLWTVDGATLTSDSVQPDADGVVANDVVVGTRARAVTLSARAGEYVEDLSFRALPDVPWQMTIFLGGIYDTSPYEPPTEPVRIWVTDRYNNPIVGHPVEWSVTSGTLAPVDTVTGEFGAASALWDYWGNPSGTVRVGSVEQKFYGRGYGPCREIGAPLGLDTPVSESLGPDDCELSIPYYFLMPAGAYVDVHRVSDIPPGTRHLAVLLEESWDAAPQLYANGDVYPVLSPTRPQGVPLQLLDLHWFSPNSLAVDLFVSSDAPAVTGDYRITAFIPGPCLEGSYQPVERIAPGELIVIEESLGFDDCVNANTFEDRLLLLPDTIAANTVTFSVTSADFAPTLTVIAGDHTETIASTDGSSVSVSRAFNAATTMNVRVSTPDPLDRGAYVLTVEGKH